MLLTKKTTYRDRRCAVSTGGSGSRGRRINSDMGIAKVLLVSSRSNHKFKATLTRGASGRGGGV